MTAWVRSRAPVLAGTDATCVFTVAAPTSIRRAISALVSPPAMCRSTSLSRPVSRATQAGGAGRARACSAATARTAAGNSRVSLRETSRTAPTRRRRPPA